MRQKKTRKKMYTSAAWLIRGETKVVIIQNVKSSHPFVKERPQEELSSCFKETSIGRRPTPTPSGITYMHDHIRGGANVLR